MTRTPELMPQLRVEVDPETLELLEGVASQYGGTAADVLSAMLDDTAEVEAILERPGWYEHIREHCRQAEAERGNLQRTYLVHLNETTAAKLDELIRYYREPGYLVAEALLQLTLAQECYAGQRRALREIMKQLRDRRQD